MAPMRFLRPTLLALLAVATLLAVAVSVAAARPEGATRTVPSIAGASSAGRDLYLVSCSSCHGADGSGTAVGPSILNAGAAGADFQLSTGRMPFAGAPGTQAKRKPPAFDQQQIDELVGYVASLGHGPAIPAVRIDEALLPRGQDLFINNCAPCHGSTARGGAVGGGALAPPLQEATNLQVAEAVVFGPGQMPAFSFSTADRDALVTYVDFLQTAPDPGGFAIGGIGPVPEGLVAWLLGMGTLLLIAVLIGRDWRGDEGGEA
jgi:ubiquinol-cytochrome c reductase cytochrome c subunit